MVYEEQELQLAETAVRTEPLGQDRFCNRYNCIMRICTCMFSVMDPIVPWPFQIDSKDRVTVVCGLCSYWTFPSAPGMLFAENIGLPASMLPPNVAAFMGCDGGADQRQAEADALVRAEFLK